MNYGSNNALKIMVDNACQPNSRWYSGSGIYRHVWLMVANEVHVSHQGIHIDTPQVSQDVATVRASISVQNETGAGCEVAVRSHIIAPDCSIAGISHTCKVIDAGDSEEYIQDMKVNDPQLWSPDTPHLYKLEIEVINKNEIADTASVPFCIRSICFDAEKGFLLWMFVGTITHINNTSRTMNCTPIE